MKHRPLAIGLALLMACYLTQFAVATATRKIEPTKFTVRVENISNPEGMTASNGQKFPFALSPGMFVLSDKTAALFSEEKPARKTKQTKEEEVKKPAKKAEAKTEIKEPEKKVAKKAEPKKEEKPAKKAAAKKESPAETKTAKKTASKPAEKKPAKKK